MKHFARPELALHICEALAGINLFTNTPIKFLAAPRRVGKSEFLRQDLIPAAVERRWTTVYVDLWVKREASPLELIQDALFREAAKHLGTIQKAVRSAGGKEISLSAGIGGIKFDPQHLDISPVSSIAHLVAFIITHGKSPVLLVIDEAQHALNTDAGMDTMFALKACRDEFMQTPGWKTQTGELNPFMCVMTGSHRDKLARLCTAKNSPFFGLSVDDFPLLDTNYVRYFIEQVEINTQGRYQLDLLQTSRVFDLLGRRPELLQKVVGNAIVNGQLDTLAEDIQSGASRLLQDLDDEMEATFLALTPLQQAVFEVLATGNALVPYAQSTLDLYSGRLGSPVGAATAQAAIEGLRNADLLWKPAKGDYQLEDTAYIAWFKRRNSGAT